MRRNVTTRAQLLGPEVSEKFKALIDEIRGYGSVIVALSGGVDSSSVAAAAKIALNDKALAVTADSPTLPPAELDDAKRVADAIGISHAVIRIDELEDPNFAKNPTNRCYYCKKGLSTHLKALAAERGVTTILDGTNADDLRGHRPGAVALGEAGVLSPLAQLGFTKAEVRQLARWLGLSIHDKPATACLSSRIAYGQEITLERLSRVGEAEAFIKSLTGARQVRVRDHGEIARIEVAPEERRLFFDEGTMERVAEKLRSLGFTYVTLDLLGYRTGSMNAGVARKD